MSSVNLHYTFAYSQPVEYRFSHDSVFLARRVFEYFQASRLSFQNGLDLCSGCGIIGLDFLFHCQKEGIEMPKRFDFLEVQSVYKDHFLENARRSGIHSVEMSFLNKNYDELLLGEVEQTYDLILCNPPYFHPGQGKLSPSEFKNRCRFFLDSDFASLVRVLEKVLSAQGQAFILLRDQSEHGLNMQQEFRRHLSLKLQMEVLEDIRGTGVVRVYSSGLP